jgi:type IV pilus assembly protein PilA
MTFSMLPLGVKSRLERAAGALDGEGGFSLVELLVVLIVIGLLAAISIAAFTGQQNKAHDAEAKTAARTAQIAMETYFVDHRSYKGVTAAALQDVQPALRDAPSLVVNQALSNQFEIQTSSSSTDSVVFRVSRSANGTITRTCTPSNSGGCKGGAW